MPREGADTVGAHAPRHGGIVDGAAVMSPRARNMPADSIRTTIMTVHMVRIGTRSKRGAPNANG